MIDTRKRISRNLMRPLLLASGFGLLLAGGRAPVSIAYAAGDSTITAGMVAAAHPEAAKAGVKIMEEGGNAMDAVLATAFTLNVVEPHASGLGGGGFLVYYNASKDDVTIYDYRETAPAALTRDDIIEDRKVKRSDFRYGGKAIATPGMLRGLLAAHTAEGSIELSTILEPAIGLAENGFVISEGLAGTITEKFDLLEKDQTAMDTFFEDGLLPLSTGDTLKQPKLAKTFRDIAERGEAALYSPESAERIAAAVQAAGGIMTATDITGYEPRVREPISGGYRGFDIETIGPPSSGGIQIIQALGLLSKYEVGDLEPMSAEYIAMLALVLNETETSAEENIGDPAFSDVPVQHLISADWTKEKGEAIDAVEYPTLLEPVGAATQNNYPQTDSGNTTHLSVIDKDGNIAALTQTINYFFASGVMVPEMGILLNNEMSDFTFTEGSPNFPEAGKIPRSSMGPMIILKDGSPVATLGTPGGTRIPGALVQIIVQKVDFGMSLQDAIDAPRIYVDADKNTIHYESRIPDETMNEVVEMLKPTGEWKVSKKGEFDRYFGGAQGIWLEEKSKDVYTPVGAADPRRDGAVASTRKAGAAKE